MLLGLVAGCTPTAAPEVTETVEPTEAAAAA